MKAAVMSITPQSRPAAKMAANARGFSAPAAIGVEGVNLALLGTECSRMPGVGFHFLSR